MSSKKKKYLKRKIFKGHSWEQPRITYEVAKELVNQTALKQIFEGSRIIVHPKYAGEANLNHIPLENYFPLDKLTDSLIQPMEKTAYYRNITSRFKQMGYELPIRKSLIVIDRKLDETKDYTSTAKHNIIVIYSKYNNQEQVNNFFNNTKMKHFSVLEDEKKHVREKLFNSKNRSLHQPQLAKGNYQLPKEKIIVTKSLEIAEEELRTLEYFALSKIFEANSKGHLFAYIGKNKKQQHDQREKLVEALHLVIKGEPNQVKNSFSVQYSKEKPGLILSPEFVYNQALQIRKMNYINYNLNKVIDSYEEYK